MTKKQSRMLIFMCWALYVSAYLGRYSYNSNILPISQFYKVSDTEVGLATSFFFFAYGAGQIVNGLLCKYYNLKYVLPLGVIGSVIINAILFTGILPFHLIKIFWLLNGVAQSVLWSSLLLALSRNLDEKYIKKAIVAMSTTASTGILISYGLSAVFALFNGFRYSFLVGAIVMFIFAVLWLVKYDKMIDKNVQNVSAHETHAPVVKRKTDKSVYKVLVVFGIFAIVINFVKDGLATWVPKILFDTYFLPESISIMLTLIIPMLTVLGTTFVLFLNKRIKNYTGLIAILFSLASVFLGIVLLLFSTTLWGIILIAFGIISLLMSGSNNVVTSILPLSLRDKANSGFLGGILNGCCYVGSTLSSVGLGALSDYFGQWLPVCYVLFGGCVFVMLIAVSMLAIGFVKNKFSKKA